MENDDLFAPDPNYEKKTAIGLIHKIYLAQLKNKRKYTASTKTKSEVRGGGRKPWRQKGTGQARAGSIRSPLWVGGGVSFGPKPRVVTKKINKKERKLAILSSLYLKEDNTSFISDEKINNFSSNKTKDFMKVLKELNIPKTKKSLIIVQKMKENFYLASRNFQNLEIMEIQYLSLTNILNADQIFLSEETLDLITEKYGKSRSEA